MTTKRPIRTARYELEGDYAGCYIVVRTNPPMRLYEDFASGDFPRILNALAAMTLESNLTNDDGEPVDMHTIDGWREQSRDVLSQVVAKINEAMTVPKANGTGSMTPSPTTKAPAPSPVSTT